MRPQCLDGRTTHIIIRIGQKWKDERIGNIVPSIRTQISAPEHA